MILRRVIEHVRNQEWTAIGIDLFIVVLGVFIGMQVSNWNQALADERLGRAYTARLVADFRQDLASRRAMLAYYAAVLESVERTDALLSDPPGDPQALVVAAYRASEIIFSPSSRATWDEIVASGDTGLLPPALARSAADYFAYDTSRDVYEGLVESSYRHRVRMVIPLKVQKALRAGCSDARNQAQQIIGFMPGCTLDLPPAVIAETAAALRADRTVQETLRYQYSDLYSACANIEGEAMKIERSLAASRARTPQIGIGLPNVP